MAALCFGRKNSNPLSISKSMKFWKSKKKLALGALLTGAIGGGAFLFGIVEPQPVIASAVFRMGYAISNDHSRLLHFYTWAMQEYNNGALPKEIDDFLSTKLRSCEGSIECQQIVDFQIRQKPSHVSDSFIQAPDNIKKGIIGNIFRRLDTFSTAETINALLLVEAIRTGQNLQKNDITKIRTQEGVVRPEALVVVKDAFRQWWAQDTAWPANKQQDPLQGTGIKIEFPY
jgi:hypothetical protein